MNESKLSVGNLEFFNKWMEVNEVNIKKSTNLVSSIYGMPVFVSNYMPKDRAVLTKDGKVVAIFKLKTWKTKREEIKK